jgi:hypothetical protein
VEIIALLPPVEEVRTEISPQSIERSSGTHLPQSLFPEIEKLRQGLEQKQQAQNNE